MYNKKDPQTIQALFGAIANSYDRTNGVLSFQLHKRWNRQLVNTVMAHRHSNPSIIPDSLLDLCCGTGEIAFTYLKKAKKPCCVYLLDFCHEMLQCAKAKNLNKNYAYPHQLSFIQADAQAIPLPSSSVTFVTIAYGIRNVKDPSLCMKEVFRVLKPGGIFGILELTQPCNRVLRKAHTFYLQTILPLLGRYLTSNFEAYQYLQQSIQSFIEPNQLEQLLLDAGFHQTTSKPISGGISTILCGIKKA